MRTKRKALSTSFKNLQESIVAYERIMFSSKWTELYSTSKWDVPLYASLIQINQSLIFATLHAQI